MTKVDSVTASTQRFSLKSGVGPNGEEREFVEGFVATTHTDKGNDKFTKSALKDMAQDINEGSQVDAVFNDVDEEALQEATVGNLDHNNNPASPFGDTQTVPAFKITEAEVKDTPDGEKGLYVKALLNKDGMLPETVSAVKNSIKNDFLNSFSIEFVPEKVEQKTIGEKVVRIIKAAAAKGAALTGRPMNPMAKITEAQLKTMTDEYKVEYDYDIGDEVSWSDTSGTVRDRSKDSCFNERIDGDVEVCGTEEAPAYLIEVDNEDETMVAHKQGTLSAKSMNTKVEYAFEIGEMVEWNETGGAIRDRIKEGQFDDEIDGDFVVTGSEEDPAYLIEVPDEGEDPDESEGTMVAHKQSFLIEEGNKSLKNMLKAEIPMPSEVQLLYPTEEQAVESADELGLEGSHTHQLDGETFYMPGVDHASFVEAVESMEGDAAHMDEGDSAHMNEEDENKALTEEQRTPPQAAQENAQRFLDAKEEGEVPDECGTGAGSETARMLVEGEPLSEQKIADIASFARHEDNKEADVEEGESEWKDCGYSMWKAWGGDEGISWAQEKNEMANEEKMDIKVEEPMLQMPEYEATAEEQWSAPDMEDFPEDYDTETIFMVVDESSDNFSDNALPVVDYRNDEATLVLEGLRSAHTVASRVDGLSEEMVSQVRDNIQEIAMEEFDVQLDEDEGDAAHMDEKNIAPMTDEEKQTSDEEPEAEVKAEEESEDVEEPSDEGEGKSMSLAEDVEELKTVAQELKETNESLKEENEELKSEVEDLRQLQEIKSEVDEVKSLLDEVELEDGPRVRQEQKRVDEEQETKAEWKRAVDRVGKDYLKSEDYVEAFAENHGIDTKEVKNYVNSN